MVCSGLMIHHAIKIEKAKLHRLPGGSWVLKLTVFQMEGLGNRGETDISIFADKKELLTLSRPSKA